jgi:Bifunctional DNA primase/polymerase, N-terminal
MSALDIALEYLRRGWSPVAISHRSKAPLDKGWPAKVVTEETAHQYFNGEAQNIGVRLGELSGGLWALKFPPVRASGRVADPAGSGSCPEFQPLSLNLWRPRSLTWLDFGRSVAP